MGKYNLTCNFTIPPLRIQMKKITEEHNISSNDLYFAKTEDLLSFAPSKTYNTSEKEGPAQIQWNEQTIAYQQNMNTSLKLQSVTDPTAYSSNVSDGKVSPNNFNSLDASLEHAKSQPKKEISLVGATVAWCSSIIGAGWMSLPKAWAYFGPTLGSIFMFLAALNGIIGIRILTGILEYHKRIKIENFGQLAELILGKRYKTA